MAIMDQLAQSKLHFEHEEYRARQRRACAELEARGLAGILLFKQESMYYLTGYDTMGYITYQCMYLGADGNCFLLTREPDRRAARMTSVVENVEVYGDGPSINPAEVLRDRLAACIARGAPVGIETDAFGLNATRHGATLAALSGLVELVEATDLVNTLRLVKSTAEMAYVRRAAELADRALDAALECARPGVSEGDLMARMQGEILRNGGDYSASRWILGVGGHALLVRHFTGHHNVIGETDQVQLEYGAAYLHYHACLFHTLYVGTASERQRTMRAVAIEALEAAKAACRPGARVGDMFEAYAGTVDRAGLRDCRLNACGYSLGATYPPTWMDGLLISRGNDAVIEPGMVFFPHMVLLDSDSGYTGCAGETLVVTGSGAEGLSRVPHELYIL